MAEFIDDTIDFAAYLKATEHQTKVKPASDFVSDAKSRLRQRSTSKRVYLPWPKCNESFEFRPGEVTLWAGQNGHGKTDCATQVALSLMGQSEKVCVASFEMKPVTTLGRMARMYAGTNTNAEEYQCADGLAAIDAIYDDFGDWSNGSLWLYDQTGTAEPDVVLGMIKYCAAELKITHVFIDSLMKCVKNEDDYNGQKDFVDKCCSLAKDLLVHIHLIHHLKKPAKEGDMPDKHDSKGSGSITDQVDNVFMVWRNKPKEDDMRAKGASSNKSTEPDLYILIRKQRNYVGSKDGEPRIALWRNADAGNFVSEAGGSAQFSQNYPHYPS